MKKVFIVFLCICLAVILLISLAGMYKFNYLANQGGYDVDGNKIEIIDSPSTIHPSWDKNKDGLNDCEDEGICDHTVDYTQQRSE
jgi:hypothetical protein